MSNPQLTPEDIFSMSDEELSKLDLNTAFADETVAEPPQTQDVSELNEDQQAALEQEANTQEEPAPEETPEKTPETDPNAEPNPEEDPNAQPDPSQGQDAPDYKALYEQVVGKPFKANGKELSVTSPEEAIKLMQMGANYHEKMAALKPVRRQARMLQDAGIASDEEIAFLLDLHKKDPKAIAKLVKDSQINLYEFDVEQHAGYEAKPVVVSDAQMSLEDTMESLKDAPGFTEMFNGLTKWDAESQDVIAKTPAILQVFQNQKESGLYDKIMNEVNRARMFNPVQAQRPIIEVYRDIDAMLRDQAMQEKPAPATNANPPQVAPLSQLANNGKPPVTASNKRQEAAAPRTAPANQKPKIKAEDIFSLSEEEFAKIDPSKFN